MSSLDLTSLMFLMSDATKGKTSTAIGYGVMGIKAGKMAQTRYKQYKFKKYDRGRMNVVISGGDDLYTPMLNWLVKQHNTVHKTLMVRSRANNIYYGNEAKQRVPPLKFGFDGDIEHIFNWMDNEYRVNVRRLADGKDLLKQEYHTLNFSCPSEAARYDLFKLFEEILEKEAGGAGRFMIPHYDGWQPVEHTQTRSLESLHLPGDQKQRIVDDLDMFLHAEDKYNNLGIPYHRGYLFHGPPGTGKSSLGKVLASHFRLDTHYLPIADLDSRINNLNSLLSNINPRSILLIEDIDAANATHQRQENNEETSGEFSISTILNVLDGPLTPHGLIVIATTNHIEVLDDAIVRAGRFDMIEEIGHCSPDQVTALFEMAYGNNVYTCKTVKDGTSPAEVVEIIKHNFTTPDKAIREFEESLV